MVFGCFIFFLSLLYFSFISVYKVKVIFALDTAQGGLFEMTPCDGNFLNIRRLLARIFTPFSFMSFMRILQHNFIEFLE